MKPNKRSSREEKEEVGEGGAGLEAGGGELLDAAVGHEEVALLVVELGCPAEFVTGQEGHAARLGWVAVDGEVAVAGE